MTEDRGVFGNFSRGWPNFLRGGLKNHVKAIDFNDPGGPESPPPLSEYA